MKMNLHGKRILSLVLTGTILTSTCLPAMASGAQDDLAVNQTKAYETIQLEAAPTKVMEYVATQTPEGVVWVENADAISLLPAAATEDDVTCAVKATDGAVWIGTKNGLMRMDLTEKDPRDMVQYFAGNRYLYNGDDHVTGLAADDNGGVWVRNASGSVHIKMVSMTMEERTYFYEKMANDVNDRRGMITDSNTFSYDPATDEYTQTFVNTNDNDGLWTAMYAMGEIMRYQTLKNEGADEAQIAAAKKAATRATKAVLLLDYISGRGNGFPCRSYMLTSEARAAVGANGMQIQNGFWFEKRMLNEGETYPDPIIDELNQEGKDPIGIATVRITKDAMDKRGSQIFPQDTDYNGLGLSQSSIDTFNTVREEGNKLGTDIVSGNRNQVFPVMVKGVNVGQSYTTPTTPITEDDIVFRLTAPIYERIPQTFNELFPDSVIGEDGYVDESQIVYKADTSSDEVDGHYALFLTAYRYLCDEAEDAELKELVAEACTRMTDLILEDDHYYIVDATGKATQWSRWLARYFNDGLDVMRAQPEWDGLYCIGVDDEKEDALSYGYEDGPLNALEVMAALKVAAYIAGAEGEADKAATYNVAYGQCFESSYSGGSIPNNPNAYENGKGYIDMALEYVERRVVRQNNDAYCDNDNKVVDEYTPGNKIFNNAYHQDWTQYVNYSDEELGWFPVYCLITLEDNSDRYGKIVEAFDQWYDGQEEREENPFYTFLYQLAHPEKNDVDLASAIRYFYRSPLVRNNWMQARGDRQDVFYIEAGNRDSRAQTNYLITWDEMNIGKHDHNPFERYQGYGQQTGTPYTYGSLDCGTVFTLPYWLGRYYGIIEETEGVRFTRATPDVTVETGSALVATVTDNGTPLSRMIVDFYSDGAYIGRARTDASGKATLEKSASGAITVTVTERLIGETMYDQVSASAESDSDEPLLSLAVMSDVHIGCTDHVMPTTFEKRFETALNYYTENGLMYDAIVLNGDLSDDPRVSTDQFDDYLAVLNANIQDGAFPIFNTGNHENYYGSQIQELFYEKTGIGDNPAYTVSQNDDATEANMLFYDTWVNGYHFIVFNHDRKDLTGERISWLESKIEEGYDGQSADPSKPVFLINHYDHNTWAKRNSTTVQKLAPIFEEHPNVVMFSGHSHASLNNIHNLFGNGVGCLSIHDGGVADIETEGDYFTSKPISQGLFVEVFEDHMLVHQLAFNDGGYEKLSAESVPFDDMLSVVITDDVDPAFESDASVDVENVTFNSCDISFPAATDDNVVSHYNIFVQDESGSVKQVDLIYNPYWLKNEPTTFTRTIKGLEPGSTGNKILVEAFDAYGNLSEFIESDPFDVESADSFDPDAPHVLSMDFETVAGSVVKDASVNQNDAKLEGGAAVVYDDVFKKNVLSLDGVGARGDANSSCARIPFNSSFYTADQITIETAFVVDSERSEDTSSLHGSDEQHILSNYETGGYSLAYDNGDGKLHFFMDGGFNDLVSDVIEADVPHHVMITYDHATLKMFVDGVLCDSAAADADIDINTTNDFFLGADSEGFQDRYQFFKGKISFVNIFDRGLSDDDAAARYAAFLESLGSEL